MSTQRRHCAFVVAGLIFLAALTAGCSGDGSLFGWIVQQDQPRPTAASAE